MKLQRLSPNFTFYFESVDYFYQTELNGLKLVAYNERKRIL